MHIGDVPFDVKSSQAGIGREGRAGSMLERQSVQIGQPGFQTLNASGA